MVDELAKSQAQCDPARSAGADGCAGLRLWQNGRHRWIRRDGARGGGVSSRREKDSDNRVGHITLTAHSGGYNAVSEIAAKGGLSDHITDVLLFDASYGGLDATPTGSLQARIVGSSASSPRHLAPANFELLTLLKKAGTKYDLTMEKDLSDGFLKQREALFIHTEDLPHDEIMTKCAITSRGSSQRATCRRVCFSTPTSKPWCAEAHPTRLTAAMTAC